MRHTRLYAGNSGQSRAGSTTHLDADFGNDHVDTEWVHKYWGEQLGNRIDNDHRNDDNRVYNERNDNHHFDERIKRRELDRRDVQRRGNRGCKYDDSRPGTAV